MYKINKIDDLIEDYHYGKLTSDEIEFMFISLDCIPELKEKLNEFIKMKYYLNKSNLKRLKKFRRKYK